MAVHISAEEMKVELIAEEKFHEDRIAHTERNFSALSMCMGGMTRKLALTRDKGDKLSKSIQDMTGIETGSVKQALQGVADCFSGLEDYRHAQIDRMEAKVVKPLVEYESTCRKAKDELKSCHNDRAKVISQQRALDRTRIRDPVNRKRILETDLQKAKFKRHQSSKSLEEYMLGFEKRRIQDLKTILGEYIQTEMLFHAKALEIYTVAYQQLDSIDEEESIQNFRNGLQLRKRGRLMSVDDFLPISTITRTGSEPSLNSQE